MSKQKQRDVKGHTARNGGNWDTNPGRHYVQSLALITTQTAFPPCHPGPELCVLGWRALGTCLALVTWVSCGTGSWQATEAGHLHNRQKVLRNTLANGGFPTRIPLHSIFCQGMPKSTLKNNLAPGKDSSWTQARVSLRRYTGDSTELLLLHPGWECGCGVNPNLRWDGKLQKSLVSIGTISGNSKRKQNQRYELCASKGDLWAL